MVLGAAMFLFVASPFLLFAVVHRFTSNPRLVVTSCGPYLACHLFLAAAYLFDDVRPREFGYLGLFLVPFYESLIALPAIVIAEATMRVIERRSGLG